MPKIKVGAVGTKVAFQHGANEYCILDFENMLQGKRVMKAGLSARMTKSGVGTDSALLLRPFQTAVAGLYKAR